jgi:hypothetical protein
LNKNAIYVLLAAILVSIGITLPRFAAGIPMSVDTTSHLYRILFFDQWLGRGVFPFWSPDWYAGSPALLLYPPLSYYLAIGLSLAGVDPVLAYKLIDATFYSLAPVAVFFLGKELGFSKGESALGALLFSIIPEVVENYLFFDRFPTVISIPIFCVFVIMFHRALAGQRQLIGTLGSMVAMSALLLTHHLSALIAGFVAVLMVALSIGKQGAKKSLVILVAVAVGTLGLTSFWLIPFARSVQLFSGNEFYNRNVTFPFLRFLYFGFDVTSYLLGVAQFVLAAVATQSVLGRILSKRIPMHPVLFFPMLLLGMALFQAGELLASSLLRNLGTLAVILSFTIFLGQFLVLRVPRGIISARNGQVLTVLWFVIFLWIGLGYCSLPFLWVPQVSEFWIRTMDVYRIWLYLALPMSLLAAIGLLRSATRIWSRRPALTLLLLALTITPIASGVVLKANYTFNASVNGVLPYSAVNAEIPPSVISYFRNDPSSGRILGINVPFWIYVLPIYVGKPILDGWYPQSKLVTPLVNINDYRLDDLETMNETARLETWKSLIANAQLLDVTWVMVGVVLGKNSLASSLIGTITQANFTQQAVIPYQSVELVIFKARNVPEFVHADHTTVQTVSQPTPDKVIVELSPTRETSTILIKQAYFPTWAAEADGKSLVVEREPSSGYMQVIIPPNTAEVTLYQIPQPNAWNIVSGVSLSVILAMGAASLLRQRPSKR